MDDSTLRELRRLASEVEKGTRKPVKRPMAIRKPFWVKWLDALKG